MQPLEISNKLPELHKKLESLVSAFSDICTENNLCYFMIGGTTLGAVRHGRFIPWDDDIDIAMPRKDYESFLKIAPTLLPEYYEIRNFNTHPHGHVYSWTKIEDNRTSLVVNWTKHLNYTSGIFIDLFPLDGCPNNKHLRRLHLRIVCYLKNLFMYSYAKLERKQSSFLRYYTIEKIKRTFVFRKSIHRIVHWLLKRYPYDTSDYVGNLLGEYGEREIMPKSYFGEGVLIQFGQKSYRNPIKYDFYLRRLYGSNYMEIPPKEKQVSLHEFYSLDLDKPNGVR